MDPLNGVGRGWAWHDKPDLQPCFSGQTVPAPAPLVSRAIDGTDLPGIDRLLAIWELQKKIGLRIWRVFQRSCPHCGGDHQERAKRAVRILKYIHDEAIPILRDAKVPEGRLREPRIHPKYRPENTTRKKNLEYYLPYWEGDPDKTKAAQIDFAVQYAKEKGHALTMVHAPSADVVQCWKAPSSDIHPATIFVEFKDVAEKEHFDALAAHLGHEPSELLLWLARDFMAKFEKRPELRKKAGGNDAGGKGGRW